MEPNAQQIYQIPSSLPEASAFSHIESITSLNEYGAVRLHLIVAEAQASRLDELQQRAIFAACDVLDAVIDSFVADQVSRAVRVLLRAPDPLPEDDEADPESPSQIV